MIPVGDSVPTRRTPWVNYFVIVVSILAFLVELVAIPSTDAFVRQWGVTPVFISRAVAGDPRIGQGVFATLVTALFLHGGWLHLGGNMLFLWVFGDNVEDRFGHLRYLLFYLLCGVGANLAQVLALPNSTVPLIGASGAIAAVLGAYIVMYPSSRITVLIPVFFIPLLLPVPAFVMLGVWFLTQFANGLATITSTTQATGGVGWWAHVGGFLLGAVITPLLPKAHRAEPAYRPLDAQAPHTLRRISPVGAAAVRSVTFAGEAINILLTLRIVLAALGVEVNGGLGAVARIVYGLSWPLVEPFTEFVPYLTVNGHVIELYSILAFLVYYALVATTAWVLALILGRRA
ncbi:MAG: rhomboid family intramembrane serine protease [Chloroflexota bacterium]